MASRGRKDRPKPKITRIEQNEAGGIETPLIPNAQEQRRQSDRFTWMMLGIFGSVGLILSLVAIIMAWNIHQRTLQEIEVQGVVQELRAGEFENGDIFYFPVVSFPLADGTRATAQFDEGRSTRNYLSGQTVTVRYEASNPDSARIQSPGSTAVRWVGPVLIGLVGAGFFAMTAFTWKVFRQEVSARENS